MSCTDVVPTWLAFFTYGITAVVLAGAGVSAICAVVYIYREMFGRRMH